MPHEDRETDRHRGRVAMWRWKPHAGKPESTEDFQIGPEVRRASWNRLCPWATKKEPPLLIP